MRLAALLFSLWPLRQSDGFDANYAYCAFPAALTPLFAAFVSFFLFFLWR